MFTCNAYKTGSIKPRLLTFQNQITFAPKYILKFLTTEMRSKTCESLNLRPTYLTDWATRKVVKFCTNKIYLLKYRFHCVL